MEQTYTSKYFRFIIAWFYPIQIFVAYTKMRGYSVNKFIGIPLDILFIILSITLIIKGLHSKSERRTHTAIYVWLGYVLCSFLLYAFYHVPIECYFDAMKISVFPILFYFWGKDTRDTSDIFYKSVMITSTVAMIIGFYLYIFTPDYYNQYLVYKSMKSMMNRPDSIDLILHHNRFSSFLESSYEVCFYAVSSMCMALAFLLNRRTHIKPIYLYVIVIVNLVASIICFQRIAMVVSVIYFVLFVFYGYRINNNLLKKLSVLTIGVLFIGTSFTFFTNERTVRIAEQFTERISEINFGYAMKARTGQYEIVDLNSFDTILGKGMGSAGHSARAHGLKGVTDGEFVKMLLEHGFIGLFIFAFLIINSFVKSLENVRSNILEIFIVLFFLMACIGANALSMYFLTGIFWFSLGRMNNKAYRQRLYNEKT